MIGSAFDTPRVEGWFDAKNQSAETVPAYGVVKVTGIETSDTPRDERLFWLTVDKPDSGMSSLVGFNGPFPIPSNAFGRCSVGRFVLVLYVDEGNVLAPGDLLGVTEDDWRLDSGGGYQFLGRVNEPIEPPDDEPKVGVFEQIFSPVTHLWGQSAAAFGEGDQIAMENVVVLGGSWSGSTATAENTFHWSGAAGLNVFALVATDGDVHAYQVEC